MQNNSTDQNECQPLTAAEAGQTTGGGKDFGSSPFAKLPPGIVTNPIAPICGPIIIYDPELNIYYS